jgi:hypothetical protein
MTTEEIEERGQIEQAIGAFVRELISAAKRIEAQRDGAIRDWQACAEECAEARVSAAKTRMKKRKKR